MQMAFLRVTSWLSFALYVYSHRTQMLINIHKNTNMQVFSICVGKHTNTHMKKQNYCIIITLICSSIRKMTAFRKCHKWYTADSDQATHGTFPGCLLSVPFSLLALIFQLHKSCYVSAFDFSNSVPIAPALCSYVLPPTYTGPT